MASRRRFAARTGVPGPAAAVEDHELGAVTNVRLLIHTLSLFGYPSLQLRVMRRARLRGGWHSVVLPFEVGARPSTNNVARDVRHHEGQKDLEEEEHVLGRVVYELLEHPIAVHATAA